MIEKNKFFYKPDRVSPPGDTLADLLEEKGMTQAELAERSGRPLKTINEIIKGKAAITPETAIQIERVMGTPAEFWNQREAHYRAYLARQKEADTLESHQGWLKQFPIKEMKKRGWITDCGDTIISHVICLLNFFGVANPERWADGWTHKRLAFRKAMNLDSKAGPTSVWLRKGEIEGEKISCKPFDKDLLIESLPKIRSLTLEHDPETFIPQLTDLCASFGVAAVFVKGFTGVPVYGASYWLTPEKALIQLSLRGKTSDILWFTIFHELGHVLKHSKKELFVEIEGQAEKSTEEAEADTFASETLIPHTELNTWLETLDLPTTNKVVHFAKELNIAPGIIVGRLQHMGKIPFSSLNELKFRYKWVE